MNLRNTFGTAVLAVGLTGASANAAISYTGGVFSEPFDSLPTAPTRTTTALALEAGSTTRFDIPGTGFEGGRAGGTGTGLNIINDDGTGNSGAVYSYGATFDASERALGTLASGTTVPAFGAEFVNNTGQTITGFDLAYVVEQYRSASNSSATSIGLPNTVVFAYGTSGAIGTATSDSYLTDPDLIPLTAGDLVSTASGTTSATVTNNPPVTTSRTVAISGLSLAPGESLFIRFTDTNDIANDAGIGIDDFTLEAVAIPEPTSLAAIGLGALGLLRRRQSR